MSKVADFVEATKVSESGLVVATEDEPSLRNPLSIPVLDEISATALL